MAARTDPALLAEVEPLGAESGRETHKLTVELLGADESRPGVRELVQATSTWSAASGWPTRSATTGGAPDPGPVGTGLDDALERP